MPVFHYIFFDPPKNIEERKTEKNVDHQHFTSALFYHKNNHMANDCI